MYINEEYCAKTAEHRKMNTTKRSRNFAGILKVFRTPSLTILPKERESAFAVFISVSFWSACMAVTRSRLSSATLPSCMAIFLVT